MSDVESLGMRQWQGFFHQKVKSFLTILKRLFVGSAVR